MQRKSRPIRYPFAVAILLLCCLVSITAVWFALHRLTAGTDATENAGSNLNLPPQHYLEESSQPDPEGSAQSDWEGRYLSVEDKLSFVEDYLNQYGYLLLETVIEPTEPLVEYLVVPTSLDVDFMEMVIGLETELWRRHRWAFRTDYSTGEVGACISLWDDHSWPDSQTAEEILVSFELSVRQLSPAHRRQAGGPKLAIVIDDWGYSSRYTESFLQYPFPLTVAIIPYLAESYRLAQAASAGGHEVILHQPMEALNSVVDLGEGGIVTSMDPDEIRQRLEENIAHLPMIVGVNNHMGSKATSDPETMAIVLETFKSKDLYFLDSYTTPSSVAGDVAAQVGIPYAVNSFFVDNVNEVEAVKEQLRRSMNQAIRSGSAIAIGHVRSATAVAIWEMIPEIVAAGVDLVPVSQLLVYPEPAVEPADDQTELSEEEPDQGDNDPLLPLR